MTRAPNYHSSISFILVNTTPISMPRITSNKTFFVLEQKLAHLNILCLSSTKLLSQERLCHPLPGSTQHDIYNTVTVISTDHNCPQAYIHATENPRESCVVKRYLLGTHSFGEK